MFRNLEHIENTRFIIQNSYFKVIFAIFILKTRVFILLLVSVFSISLTLKEFIPTKHQ